MVHHSRGPSIKYVSTFFAIFAPHVTYVNIVFTCPSALFLQFLTHPQSTPKKVIHWIN